MNTARRLMLTLLAAAVLLTGCAGARPAGDTAGDSGSTAPLAFSGTTLDGAGLDGSTFAGKPVVLWFWAPWCTICRAEAPDVAAVAAQLAGQVTFLGVPGLGPEADMRQFVADTGTSGFTHVVDSDGSLWRHFGVVAQPAFVFVAGDGTAQSFAGSLPVNTLRDKAAGLANS